MKGKRKFEGCLFENPEPERRFYLYRHLRNDTGEVFYIGRGTGNRYLSTFGRNQFWHRVVDKSGGFTSQRFLVNLTAEESIQKEREFVSLYGRRDLCDAGTLTNLTDGGEGMYAYKVSKDTRNKMSAAKLENPTKFWLGKKRPDLTGASNNKSKAVVNTESGERFESVAELSRSLEIKYQTVLAWLIGQNKKPDWFSFEYESNL